jgi:hypothetical protein
MKLHIAAVLKQAWQETLEQSKYRILEKRPEGYILQWLHDQPELWVPGSSKSYQIVIDGVPHDYAGYVEFPGWNKNRPAWMDAKVPEVLEEPDYAEYGSGLKEARLKATAGVPSYVRHKHKAH